MSHGNWKDLFAGIEKNDLELVKYHIKTGVDVNYQHPEFLTSPLIESIRLNHIEMMILLLENGASPDIKEVYSGKSPVLIANEIGNSRASELLNRYLKPGT
jgi:uncharacterized protein